jgi:radical SAM protein with 4Fe4S-binding SPASM domain
MPNFNESPLLVFYEVTQACDLACRHCRACAQTRPDPAELTTNESRLLIDQLASFETPPMLVLTGGDPLKRADIFALIEYAANLGLRVAITPSATPLVTPAAICRLRDSGISRIAISLDGADEQTHDAMRGFDGTMKRSLEVLADARDAGLSIQVNTTLTRLNFDQIDRMAELLATQHIDMWSVFFLIPTGRGGNLPRLSADECEQAFERLWAHAQLQPYQIKTTEAPHYRRFVIQHQRSKPKAADGFAPFGFASAGVNDGKGVMFVGHTGMVYPSGFLPVACGIFPRENVVKIYQNSPIFQGLRDTDRLQGKCHDCEFRNVCGGSRARAYAVTGDMLVQEPDCSYVPALPSRRGASGSSTALAFGHEAQSGVG